jgi:hypothetical protein
LEIDDGIDVSDSDINPALKPHQRVAVRWALRGGRRALFERFGLGKSVQQLEIERLLLEKCKLTRGLIVTPLGVRQEFIRDSKEVLGWENVPRFVNRDKDAQEPGIYLTNYESIRDGKLDHNLFDVVSLDEAGCLRAAGGSKTFRECMARLAGDRKTMDSRVLSDGIKYRFVATATPSPNDYIELLVYSQFLGVMDISGAKTRFFKRDSTKADHLTLHPHKEREFWLWVSTWALFLQSPEDLGFDGSEYVLPKMHIIKHEVSVDHTQAAPDGNGQLRMYRDASHGVVEAAREKRDTLPERLEEMKKILADAPDDHFLLWHDLEIERHAIEKSVPGVVTVYGKQRASQEEMEKLEAAILDFSEGRIKYLAGKAVMLGSGCNFQRHCHKAIFLGINFKFNDIIQAVMRLVRYLQKYEVEIHWIYAESERSVLKALERKWAQHDEQVAVMQQIIREYGLSHDAMARELTRTLTVERIEVKGEHYRIVNNDAVVEAERLEDNSIGLILTSPPFSSQYEYSSCYADLGHSDTNEEFFEQMDYLTPHLVRALAPGRIKAVHVKDRIVPGGLNGLGFQTVYPFHCRYIDHCEKHGLAFIGMKTIVTDVVRENNQTYRLGWTEQCKDGSKMGVGMSEYLLLFRKPPTDNSNSYADLPVIKAKDDYSRSRWQIDAHGFARSSGNRLLTCEEIEGLPHEAIFKLFRRYSYLNVYDYEHHVRLSESLERCRQCNHIHTLGTGELDEDGTAQPRGGHCKCGCKGAGRLPVTFMLLQPQSWHPDIWSDITRMRTLNSQQSAKNRVMHLCAMQIDLADRVIRQFSNPGDIVLDPFGGVMTVPYRAVSLGRQAVAFELSPTYFIDGTIYCEAAEHERNVPTLFDLIEEDSSLEEAAL